MASEEDKELQQALDLSLSGGSQDKQQTVQPAVNENVVQPQQNTTSTSPLNLSSDAMALLLAALNSAHTADQIKMGVGKIAAQCCHAAIGLYQQACSTSDGTVLLRNWESEGGCKVALKVPTFNEMMDINEKATKAGLRTHLVMDAGKTQIAPGSVTVLGLLGYIPFFA